MPAWWRRFVAAAADRATRSAGLSLGDAAGAAFVPKFRLTCRQPVVGGYPHFPPGVRSMRRGMPKHSVWRVMQFDTLRLRLIKLAARVIELKTQIKIHLPSSAPDQAIFAMLLERLPRLVT